MLVSLLFIYFLQAEPVLQSRGIQVLVPNGWKEFELAGSVRLVHTSGASFQVRRSSRRSPRLKEFAELGVEQVWLPLGFVTVGDPLERKVRNRPAVQYDVRGNRLSHRRRISYIAVDRGDEFLEITYENSEEGFDLLSSEAERIASSVQPITEANEAQAVSILRTLNTAEIAYFADNRRHGLLSELVRAGLVSAALTEVHNGYRFSITLTRDGYVIEGIPTRLGLTGRFAFRSDNQGVIKYSDQRRLAPAGLAGRPVQD